MWKGLLVSLWVAGGTHHQSPGDLMQLPSPLSCGLRLRVLLHGLGPGVTPHTGAPEDPLP